MISNGRLPVSAASAMSKEIVGVGEWTFVPEIPLHGIVVEHHRATPIRPSGMSNFKQCS